MTIIQQPANAYPETVFFLDVHVLRNN